VNVGVGDTLDDLLRLLELEAKAAAIEIAEAKRRASPRAAESLGRRSTEPGCWVPIVRAERVVLAGDHRQLPPTILSPEASAAGLGVSLFERLIELYPGRIARRLDVQYRMHRRIMAFPSRELYDGTLEADPSVAEHRLADLAGVIECPVTSEPVELIDTAGAGFEEELEPDGVSKRNVEEARLAIRKVAALAAAGVPPRAIAVITPYAAQVRLIRRELGALDIEGVEVDSVDGFQGREKETIVISLVRSNADQEIGFLADIRRMNVAMTRARRKLIVIGDSATLAADGFYRRLIAYAEEIDAVRTTWEIAD
jgi:ATP-dependent RNA/DNA helicase IGHMBP2